MILTLSLHDALPISVRRRQGRRGLRRPGHVAATSRQRAQALRSERARLQDRLGLRFPVVYLGRRGADRKSTRLNSSHVAISYAVFCLKKKTNPTDVT